MFGIDVDASSNEYSLSFIELGHGIATTPSLHTGLALETKKLMSLRNCPPEQLFKQELKQDTYEVACNHR